MVTLVSTTKRFIGKSTDVKPYVGQLQEDGSHIGANDLPAGSTFLDENGDMWRWDGSQWTLPSPETNRQTELLEAIFRELRLMRGLQEEEFRQVAEELVEEEELQVA